MNKDINEHVPDRTAEAVGRFTRGEMGVPDAISFLQSNPDEINEFCLQVIESYRPDDRLSGAANLAQIIKKLIAK